MLRSMILSVVSLFSLLVGTVSSQPPTLVGGDAQRYSEVVAIDTCSNSITVPNGFAYRPGDRVMMIQMKGAVIDSSESRFAGQVIDAGNAGHYQLNTVVASTANSVTLLHPIDASFNVVQSVQCIRIVAGRSIRTTAPLEVQPWNGLSGGVLVIECMDTLFLNHDILVQGRGFRGGAPSRNQADSNISRMFIDVDDGRGGVKGEGPVRLPTRLACGKAPAISGGGGGNAGNGGGGGGAMISRGGHGGRQTTEYSRFDAGGIGGYPPILDYSQLRLLVGSGGGGGHQNDFVGGRGGNGGGLVLISAKVIVASGARRIDARGTNGDSTTGDGAGGGGSGGMVILDIDTISGNITVDVSGGNGGMAFPFGSACYAPGGGGGGGIVGLPVNRRILSGNFLSRMDPGRNGVNQPELFQCAGDSHLGATSGEIGEIVIVGPLRHSSDTVPRPILEPRDTTICPGDQIVARVAAASSVRWIPAALVESPAAPITRTVPVDRDTFVVAAMSIRGQCEVFDTVFIRVHPKQDSTLVAGPRGPCIGQSTSYSLPIATATVPLWHVSSISGSISKRSSTLDTTWSRSEQIRIRVEFTDTLGCQQQVAITVNVADSITPSIQGIVPLCQGDSIRLDGGSGYSEYEWTNGATTQFTTVSTAGPIGLTVRSANGCQGSTSAVIPQGRQPRPRLSAPRFELESINDAIPITIDDAGQRVEWSDGSTGTSIMARRGGRYWAVVTSEDGCRGSSDTITIIGFRKGAPVLLSVDDVRYRPGQLFTLPVRITSTEARLENLRMSFDLETNGFCVIPQQGEIQAGQTIARTAGQRVNRNLGQLLTTITLEIDSTFVGEMLLELPAIGALGNEITSSLGVSSCTTSTEVTDCEIVRTGTATNEQVCRDGGNRLFDGTAIPHGFALDGPTLRWTTMTERQVFCLDGLGRQLPLELRQEGTTIMARPLHQPAVMWWLIIDGSRSTIVPILRE